MARSREGHVYAFVNRTKVGPLSLGEVPLEQSDASLALSSVDRNPMSSTRNEEMTVEERPPATQCKPLFFTADSVA